MNNAFGVLILTGVLFAGTIVLQIFLSKAKSKIPGLILPAITFLLAVVVTVEVILAGAVYRVEKTKVEEITMENEDSVTHSYYVPEEKVETTSTAASHVLIGLTTFLLYNIPTLLYGGIYISCRKKKRAEDGGKNSDVDKMKIQDL